jgi:chromate transporter
MTDQTAANARPAATLGELAALFLRLGCTAFGGPAAHVAIMQQEVVERRRWLSPERFLDLFGAANIIPGPKSPSVKPDHALEMEIGRTVAVFGKCQPPEHVRCALGRYTADEPR